MRGNGLSLSALIILLVAPIVALPIPKAYAAQSVTLGVDPPSGTIIYPTYTINVNISYVENLWAVHFQLSFNDDVDFLKVTVPQGVEPGELPGPGSTVDSHVGSIEGITYLDVTVLMPNWENNGTVTGEGNIAKITLELTDDAMPEMTSWLKLEWADVTVFTGSDFEPAQITSLQPGSVVVGSLVTLLTLRAPSTTTVEKPVTPAIDATLTDGNGNPLAGQTIHFYVDSQEIAGSPVTTNANGFSSIPYTPLDVGTFTITAQFFPISKYQGSSDTASLTVNPMDTTLLLYVPWTIKVGDTKSLTAALWKDTTAMQDAPIHFYVNSLELPGSPTNTNSSGIASLEYTFNAVGEYEIRAEYSGTSKYNPSEDIVTRVAASAITSLALTAEPNVVKADEPVTLSATLKNETGSPLPNFQIDFYIYLDAQSQLGSTTTDSNGVASIEYRPPMAGWLFQLEAIYPGNLTYTGSNAMTFISVLYIQTSLTLNMPTATVDKSAVLTATLLDENQNPISDASIDYSIYMNDQWNDIGSALTDASGIASLNYAPPAVGSFQVQASYNGSSKYLESSDTDELTVNPLATTLSLDMPASTTVEETVVMSAVLKDQDGNPIADATIDFSIFSVGWNLLDSTTTNTNGIASSDYTPTESGVFNIKAEYDGSPKHDKSTSNTATIAVNRVNTTLAINMPVSASVQTPITISAVLKDEDGNSMPNAIIYYQVFKDEDEGWKGIGSTPTNPDGIASMNYQPAKEGTFKFKAMYNGNQKYAGSESEEATLEVAPSVEPPPGEPPGNPWDFLGDEQLTVLDLLFWGIIILVFSTIFVIIVWKKIK